MPENAAERRRLRGGRERCPKRESEKLTTVGDMD